MPIIAPRSYFDKRVYPSFIKDLYDYTEQAMSWEKTRQDIIGWVQNNRYIEGEPWNYSSSGPRVEWGEYDIKSAEMPRPYLIPFVRDSTRIKSCIKPRQSEFTENSINEALYYALTRNHTRISHVFPTDELGDAISNEKILPAIIESPAIRAKSKERAVRRYSFSNSSMYTVTGALKKAGGRAASRDMIIFDEVDSMPDSIFGIYEQLLSHSSLGFIRKISTPTVPNIGIDAIVKTGCEYEWVTTCPKCKREQTFSFPENVINYFDITSFDPDNPAYKKRLNKVYIGCRYCKEYVNRASVWYERNSLWVPRKEELVREHASYYVNAFMIPWKTGKELLSKFHILSDYAYQHANEVIGISFLKDAQNLTLEEIYACERPWSMMTQRTASMRNVSVGIDWGEKESWVVVCANGIESQNAGRRSVVYVERIDAQALKRAGFSSTGANDHVVYARDIIKRFQADIIINDANGLGVDRNAFLIKTFGPKRTWGCFFDTAEEGRQIRQSKLQVPMWSPTKCNVTISKVNAWKEITGEFRRQALCLPNRIHDPKGIVSTFIKHQQALIVQPRWSIEYNREFEVVVKVNKDDHLACAHMYAKVGWDKLVGFKRNNVPGIGGKKIG